MWAERGKIDGEKMTKGKKKIIERSGKQMVNKKEKAREKEKGDGVERHTHTHTKENTDTKKKQEEYRMILVTSER